MLSLTLGDFQLTLQIPLFWCHLVYFPFLHNLSYPCHVCFYLISSYSSVSENTQSIFFSAFYSYCSSTVTIRFSPFTTPSCSSYLLHLISIQAFYCLIPQKRKVTFASKFFSHIVHCFVLEFIITCCQSSLYANWFFFRRVMRPSRHVRSCRATRKLKNCSLWLHIIVMIWYIRASFHEASWPSLASPSELEFAAFWSRVWSPGCKTNRFYTSSFWPVCHSSSGAASWWYTDPGAGVHKAPRVKGIYSHKGKSKQQQIWWSCQDCLL